jgi:GNAT superfamily N-acetyltransferase
MSSIVYKDIKDIAAKQLEALFLSNEWESGQYPEDLHVAMVNSGAVFTAWDGDRLVGLINALDDSRMTAYIHYMLVAPAYQGMGIGASLMEMVKEYYRDYLTLVLVSYGAATEFYLKSGFTRAKDGTAMFLSKAGL